MRIAAAVLALDAAGSIAGASIARADSGNSDPARMCLDGLQWDDYTVLGGDPEAIVFGGHTCSFVEVENSYYVDTASHDACSRFLAEHESDAKSGGTGRADLSDIVITKAVDKSSPGSSDEDSGR
jgi:hypothetical protein